jgi:ubiquinone/menaquinone biosynthesis C-methylase UbiE
MMDLSCRQREEEWIDAPDADPKLLEKSLRFIQRINSLLGYTRATLGHLKRFSRGWETGASIRILDVATGSADIPRAILRWARRRKLDVRVIGLDRQAVIAATARGQNADRSLLVVRGDPLRLPFADQSIDYVLTNMFLHHLDEPQVVTVLKEMARVARRGIIAADLIRNRRAYFWINLFTLLANPMVRHDARVSVAQAFTRREIIELCRKAEIRFASYHHHFGHRFVLSGERGCNC